MKKLLLTVSFAFPFLVFAQLNSSEVVYKEWSMLGESNTHVDVFYRVIKCTSTNQIHLFVFNESPKDQTASFVVDIANASGKKLSRTITLPLAKAGMYRATCEDNKSLKALKLDLPKEYEPGSFTVKISFKQ